MARAVSYAGCPILLLIGIPLVFPTPLLFLLPLVSTPLFFCDEQVYQQADVYLLDDCLSAVDSQVARYIFKHCITGLLASKTVLLVTHNLHTLPSADQVLLLEHQTLAFKGTFQDFKATGHPFAKQSIHHDEDGDGEEGSSGTTSSIATSPEGDSDDEAANSGESKAEKEKVSANAAIMEKKAKERGGQGTTLIEKEAVGVGSASVKLYKAYIHAAGGVLVFIVAIGCLVSAQVLQIG